MFTSGTQLVARTVGLTSVGRQLVARTVGATNMGRQCDKKVQTASFSKTTSDLCTDENATIKSTTTHARCRLGLYV